MKKANKPHSSLRVGLSSRSSEGERGHELDPAAASLDKPIVGQARRGRQAYGPEDL